MRGTILGVHDGRGVLLSADDRRLEFPLVEWRSAGGPAPGQAVDFVEEQGQARSVFAIPAAPTTSNPRSGSFVLGLIALGCLAVGFIIPVLPTIFAFVFGVLGAQRAQEDRDETGLLLSRLAWIGALVVFALMVVALLGLAVIFGSVLALHDFSLGPMD